MYQFNKTSKAVVSLFTVVVFAFTSLGSVPNLQAATQSLIPQSEVAISRNADFVFSVPANIGKIENFKAGQGAMIAHIQTAHGSYEAQQKIRQILHFLEKNYGIDTLLIEGSASEVLAETLNFVPQNQEINQKIADALTRAALVSGEELYLLDKVESDAKAYGIENLDSYIANGKAFAETIKAKEKTGNFLRKMDEAVNRFSDAYLSNDLKVFLRNLENFETSKMSLDAWITILKDSAQKIIYLDLTEPQNQFEFPIFVRLLKLREFYSKIDEVSFSKESVEFLRTLAKNFPQNKKYDDIFASVGRLLSSRNSDLALPNPETGFLFEEMVKGLPADFDYDAYPNVRFYIGALLLKSEIKAEALIVELENLQEKIVARLAKTSAERVIVSVLKDYRVLEKLFSLELSANDYEKILLAGERNLLPSKVASRFGGIAQNDDVLRVKDVTFGNLEKIDELFGRAMSFYAGAKTRDLEMMQNIEKRVAELGAKRVAIITGGFHSKPFEKYFSDKNYTYALITPQMISVDERGRKDYVNAVMGNFTNLAKASTYAWDVPRAVSDGGVSPAVVAATVETARKVTVDPEVLAAVRARISDADNMTPAKSETRSADEDMSSDISEEDSVAAAEEAERLTAQEQARALEIMRYGLAISQAAKRLALAFLVGFSVALAPEFVSAQTQSLRFSQAQKAKTPVEKLLQQFQFGMNSQKLQVISEISQRLTPEGDNPADESILEKKDEIINFLLKNIRSQASSEVGLKSAALIAKFGASAVDPLIEELNGNLAAGKPLAAHALGLIGEDAKEKAAPELLKIIKGSKTNSLLYPQVLVARATLSYALLGTPYDESVLEDMINVMKQIRDAKTQYEMAKKLAADQRIIKKYPDDLAPVFIQRTKDYESMNSDEYQEVMIILVKINTSASIDVVNRSLFSSSFFVSTAAVRALAEIPNPTKKEADYLLEKLNSGKTYGLVGYICDTLAKYAFSSTIPELEKYLKTLPTRTFEKNKKDDGRAAKDVKNAIEKIKTSVAIRERFKDLPKGIDASSQVVQYLSKEVKLSDDDWTLGLSFAEDKSDKNKIMERIALEGRENLYDLLFMRLDSSDWKISADAANIIALIKEPPPQVIEKLVAAFERKDSGSVFNKMCLALIRWGAESEPALVPLKLFLEKLPSNKKVDNKNWTRKSVEEAIAAIEKAVAEKNEGKTDDVARSSERDIDQELRYLYRLRNELIRENATSQVNNYYDYQLQEAVKARDPIALKFLSNRDAIKDINLMIDRLIKRLKARVASRASERSNWMEYSYDGNDPEVQMLFEKRNNLVRENAASPIRRYSYAQARHKPYAYLSLASIFLKNLKEISAIDLKIDRLEASLVVKSETREHAADSRFSDNFLRQSIAMAKEWHKGNELPPIKIIIDGAERGSIINFIKQKVYGLPINNIQIAAWINGKPILVEYTLPETGSLWDSLVKELNKLGLNDISQVSEIDLEMAGNESSVPKSVVTEGFVHSNASYEYSEANVAKSEARFEIGFIVQNATGENIGLLRRTFEAIKYYPLYGELVENGELGKIINILREVERYSSHRNLAFFIGLTPTVLLTLGFLDYLAHDLARSSMVASLLGLAAISAIFTWVVIGRFQNGGPGILSIITAKSAHSLRVFLEKEFAPAVAREKVETEYGTEISDKDFANYKKIGIGKRSGAVDTEQNITRVRFKIAMRGALNKTDNLSERLLGVRPPAREEEEDDEAARSESRYLKDENTDKRVEIRNSIQRAIGRVVPNAPRYVQEHFNDIGFDKTKFVEFQFELEKTLGLKQGDLFGVIYWYNTLDVMTDAILKFQFGEIQNRHMIFDGQALKAKTAKEIMSSSFLVIIREYYDRLIPVWLYEKVVKENAFPELYEYLGDLIDISDDNFSSEDSSDVLEKLIPGGQRLLAKPFVFNRGTGGADEISGKATVNTKYLPSGTLLMDPLLLTRFISDSPRALFYLLKAAYENGIETAFVTVSKDERKLVEKIEKALSAKNVVDANDKEMLSNIVAALKHNKLIRVEHAREGKEKEITVIKRLIAQSGGSVICLDLGGNISNVISSGYHFILDKKVGGENLFAASVLATALKRAADLIHNIPDADVRADLLTRFVEENLPGITKNGNVFRISAIAVLAERFVEQSLIARSA